MNYLRYKGFCANIYYDSFLKSYYVIIKYHGESVIIKANTVENLEYEFYEKVDELMSDEEDKGVNLKTCPFCNKTMKLTKRSEGNNQWWMIVGNKCFCGIYLESKPFPIMTPIEEKEKIKNELIKRWNTREEPEHA